MNDLKDLEEIYKSRRANLCTWMAQNSIGMVLIEDSEANRNPALRYFCGLPSDGILGISINGLSILSPWDENLAAKIAFADIVAGFNQFNRSATAAAAATPSFIILSVFVTTGGIPRCRASAPSGTRSPPAC